MEAPYVDTCDPRDPECPEDYDPDWEWDRYLEECDRDYEERQTR